MDFGEPVQEPLVLLLPDQQQRDAATNTRPSTPLTGTRYLSLCFVHSGFLLGQFLLQAALQLISLPALRELFFEFFDLLLAFFPLR